MNNSIHNSTGETPSKLLFGVTQRGPEIDELTELLGSRQDPSQTRDLSLIRDGVDKSKLEMKSSMLNGVFPLVDTRILL